MKLKVIQACTHMDGSVSSLDGRPQFRAMSRLGIPA